MEIPRNLISDSTLVQDTFDLLTANDGRAPFTEIADVVFRLSHAGEELAALLVADLIRNDPRSLRVIGEDYGVDRSYIWKLKKGWHWRHSWVGCSDADKDRASRGKMIRARGEKSARARLTEKQVLAIREDIRPSPRIAVDYQTTKTAILNIKNRKTWGWLL